MFQDKIKRREIKLKILHSSFELKNLVVKREGMRNIPKVCSFIDLACYMAKWIEGAGSKNGNCDLLKAKC